MTQASVEPIGGRGLSIAADCLLLVGVGTAANETLPVDSMADETGDDVELCMPWVKVVPEAATTTFDPSSSE